MTSSERVEAAFKHISPDRTPIFEYVLNSREITEWILKRPCSYLHWNELIEEEGWEKALFQVVADRLDIVEFLKHDLIYAIPNRISVSPAKDSNLEEISPYADPVEQVCKRNKQYQEPVINEDSLLIYELLDKEMKKRGLDAQIIAPVYGHGVWTDVALMQTMVLAPEIARKHFELATRSCLKKIEAYRKSGIKIYGIGGDFAGNKPLISPECYRNFIMPELKILADRIHELGGLAVNTSDGNLWDVVDDFLIGTGVDGYMEIDQHAGMDLKILKQKYGSRITFIGNMDCGNMLSSGTGEEIRNATVQCLEDGLGNGGHIFTASNAITDSIPLENYLTMLNTYRDFWGMAKVDDI